MEYINLAELPGGRLVGATMAGIFNSEDFGLTWQRLPNTPPRNIRLLADGNRLWGEFYSIFGYTHSFISYSDDAGTSWDTVAVDQGDSYPFAVGGYLFAIKGGKIIRYDVSTVPTTIDTVLTNVCGDFRFQTSGQKIWLSSACGLIRSSDLGMSWDTVQNTWAQHYGGGLSVSGDTIIWITDNGAKRSIDGGSSWQGIDLNFSASLVWREGHLYGVGEGLRRSDDAGLTWDVLWVPTNITQTMDNMYQRGNVLVGNSDEGIWRSIDGGVNWYLSNSTFKTSSLYDFGSAGPFLWDDDDIVMNFSGDEGHTWFAPIVGGKVLHVKVPGYANGTLYGITYDNKLYRSTGSIKIWEPVASTSFPPDGRQLVNIGNALFLATSSDSTRIYRSLDQGVSWTKMQAWSNENFSFSSFVVGGSTLYVYHKSLGIVKSTDLGVTWVMANGALTPDQQGGYDNLVATPNFLYLRNAASVFASRDGGENWIPMALELNGEYLGDIVARDSTLFAYYGSGGMKISIGLSGVWQQPLGYAHFGYPVDNQKVMLLPDALVVFLRYSNKAVKYDLGNFGFTAASGRVFDDINANGVQNAGENGYANALLWLSQSERFTETDALGDFSAPADLSGDTLRVVPPLPYSIVNPPFHLISSGNAMAKNFAISRQPGITDVSVALTNYSPFRPGFHNQLAINLQNIGTVAADGTTLQLALPTGLQFLFASVTPTNVQGNIITWTFDALAVAETQIIVVQLSTPSSIPIGTALQFNLTANTLLADHQLANNQVVVQTVVVGAFDPNDKQVSPLPYTTAHLADGTPLTYTIRFQNTGNHPAERVRIVDTLSELLDPLSIQIINSSHPVTRTIQGVRTLEFLFDNINLPDSVLNEVASHGFVQFSIRPKSQVTVGDDISNTAHIYFDFNAAITTNTAHAVVTMPVRVTSAPSVSPLIVFPNPASEKVWVRLPEDISGKCRLDVVDALGNTLSSRSFWSVPQTLLPVEIDRFPAGFYLIVLRGEHGQAVGKVRKL